jgi:hypothetical protein
VDTARDRVDVVSGELVAARVDNWTDDRKCDGVACIHNSIDGSINDACCQSSPTSMNADDEPCRAEQHD